MIFLRNIFWLVTIKYIRGDGKKNIGKELLGTAKKHEVLPLKRNES